MYPYLVRNVILLFLHSGGQVPASYKFIYLFILLRSVPMGHYRGEWAYYNMLVSGTTRNIALVQYTCGKIVNKNVRYKLFKRNTVIYYSSGRGMSFHSRAVRGVLRSSIDGARDTNFLNIIHA